jgi:AcrR family transcriptional regulator
MERDSEKTRTRILEAVGGLLARKGFAGMGVNAIARASGVDKVLIYRYFGGLRELLREYAARGGFWPTIAELAGKPLAALGDPVDFAAALLAGHLRELRRRPITQEIMRWELHERNELTDELARFREQQGIEILGLAPGGFEADGTRDPVAAAALIQAGLTYLVLRAKTADVYLGIDLRDEAGWGRLTRAAEGLVRAYLKGVPS